jgi:hypothetical protein
MILLAVVDVTSIQTTMGSVTKTITTDTLFVTDVRIDFTTGAMYTTIQRGTGSPFVANMDPLEICVNPDGSFISTDGTWAGSVSSAPALVTQLKATFDQFILASGKVSGTEI